MNNKYFIIVGLIIIFLFFLVKKRKNKECMEVVKKENDYFNNPQVKLYNECARQIYSLLNFLDVEWWVCEGTLIGMLRWGSNFGKIEDGLLVTDTDIDIMVRVHDDHDWDKLKSTIEKKLLSNKYWKTCASRNDNIGVQRDAKFTCYSGYIFGKDCYGNEGNIHVDIHSYYVDEENNSIFMDPICNYYPEECKKKYPFQTWGGSAPYKGLIVDENGKFKTVKFLDMNIPCPFNYIEILKKWNDYEYKDGQLHLPYKNCVFNNSWKIHEKELQESDLKLLKDEAHYLDENNYASFHHSYFNCRHNRELCFGKDSKFYNLSKSQMIKIYKELEESKLVCFLSGGTLLGLIREKNLLKNDDDIDITILPKSKECFEKIEKIFENNGYNKTIYEIKIRNTTYPGQYTFSKNIDGYLIEFDICIIWNDPFNKRYILTTYFKSTEYYIFNQFELKRIEFLGENFNIPKDEIYYIQTSYGENWHIENTSFKYIEYGNIVYNYNNNLLEFHEF